jgi:putative hemolysin
MLKLKLRERPFPELSYASPHQPALTRWFIHSIEGLSGRDRFAALYDFWRRQVVPRGERVFSRMLELIDVRVRTARVRPGDIGNSLYLRHG